MKNSQYLEEYQDLCKEYLEAGKKPITPGSFIAYNLRGDAKLYSGRYMRALINSLKRSGWVTGPSYGGSTAYYPPNTELQPK